MGKSVPGWPGVERAAERFALGGPAAAVAGGTAARVQWWEPVPDPPVGIADSSEFERRLKYEDIFDIWPSCVGINDEIEFELTWKDEAISDISGRAASESTRRSCLRRG